MLLKQADDKSKRIQLLENLQQSPRLDTGQKKWLREELGRLKKGIQGERESAYFLDQYFKDRETHVLLHDLRLVFEGEVAQIDHLILARGSLAYLVETKNYAGSVHINEYGEFTVDYDGDRFGVESPIEQSRRHERILLKVFDLLGIGRRTGGAVDCRHVVMFHPKAVIERPDPRRFDARDVIKADQFPTWHQNFVGKDVGFGELVGVALNLRSLDTIREWGEKLKRQHRPASLLDLPEFMQPKPEPEPAPVSQAREPAPAYAPAARPAAPAAVASPTPKAGAFSGDEYKRKLVCMHCGAKISFPEGKFCWNQEARFKGGQYCREHQALFR